MREVMRYSEAYKLRLVETINEEISVILVIKIISAKNVEHSCILTSSRHH
jgi:hypothetical protein